MIRVCLFVEDVAQETLVRGLVLRLANLEGTDVDLVVLNAEGGEGRVWTSLRRKRVVHLVADVVPVVVATPVPYVESWYVADPKAVGRALGQDVLTDAATRRTRRDLKAALRNAVTTAIGQRPALGGAEHGHEVATVMDLDIAGRQAAELATFCTDLRSALRLLASTDTS